VRRHEVVPGLTTLALASIAVLGGVHSAAAAHRPATVTPNVAPAVRPDTLAAGADSTADLALRLGRAAAAHRLGRPWDVIANLAQLDLAAEIHRAGADRAAFLLAEADREVGALAAFDSLAARVAPFATTSPFLRWIAWQSTLDRVESGGDLTTAGDEPALAAERGALTALATADSSQDLAAVATPLDTTTALGRDLAGALFLRAADREAARGGDPRMLLARVPAESRDAASARRLAAEAAIERGERDDAGADLRALAADSLAPARRRVLLDLAALAMDAGRWSEAESLYTAADTDWSSERRGLSERLAQRSFADLWSAWRSAASPGTLAIDGAAADSDAARLAGEAADLGFGGDVPLPAAAGRSAIRFGRPIPPPPPAEWTAVMRSARALANARGDSARVATAADAERERLERFRRLLAVGQVRMAREDSELDARGLRLDSLATHLAAIDRRLQEVRDEAIRRVVARARAISSASESERLAIHGMRHLRLEGPHRIWATWSPEGFPTPDTLLTAEDSLAARIGEVARRLEVEGPEKIHRSYMEAWRPRLIERVGTLTSDHCEVRAWERRLDRAVDSTLAAAQSSPALRALDARLAAVRHRADSLAVADGVLRDRAAAGAVTRALDALAGEREGLDYGLAASAYAASVGLGAEDSNRTASSTPMVESGDAIALRRRAIERMRAFVADHPHSEARGEMRFRLADLTLVQVRADFRTRMADYVKRQSAGEAVGPPPLLDDGGALDLYRTILREDSTFTHLDAVRFDAGMLLADAADPAAEAMFLDLVTIAPRSTYAPEAWMRLGDLRFAVHRFREAGDAYAHATEATDPTLRAVATYKLGWSAFRDERFLDAAGSFRDVLDLYASGRDAIHADVEKEADSWLVQALVRAGGAESYAQLFASAPRPYEHRILLELAQQFRRYDRFADAIAADQMALDRAPLSPDALLSARRMIDTYARWNEPRKEREAMTQLAPRFVPGGAWAEAQSVDSVRTAGSEFARRSWLSLAGEHQREARARDDASAYRAALETWETVLAHWPDDPDAARDHLLAAEDAARLERFPAALAHAAAAARAADDSLRGAADWQQVAISDAWYERRRGGHRDGFEPDVDSLAHGMLAAADRYVERHPADPRDADLRWRQGQVAFAHAWYDRAATDLGRFAAEHPQDPRVPRAAAMRADATFRLDRFADAGAAYEEARLAAAKAGEDTLARRMAAAVPICFYRDAEAAVAADSTNYVDHATRFERVATRFPAWEHADLAQYRSGLAWLHAGRADDAVRAMTALVTNFPSSEYVRDAELETARALEQQGKKADAALALGAFATHFSADTAAADAMLHAGDLYEAAGHTADADSMRLAYVKRYPQDLETGMAVYESLARRELAHVDAEHPLSALLPATPASTPAVATKPARGRHAKNATTAPPLAAVSKPTPASSLAEYLKRATAHPELASKSLLGEVRFRLAEESRAAAAAVPLTLPLAASLPRRQRLLDQAIARYREAAGIGVTEWANASACRIGETLIDFGQALEASEKPADLKGDDLAAYRDVLADKAQIFYDRAEGVWGELVRQKGATTSKDAWVIEARTALWKRLGLRFAFQPESEMPRIAADVPERPKAPKTGTKKHDAKTAARDTDRPIAGDTP